jgi:hypothetical protein
LSSFADSIDAIDLGRGYLSAFAWVHANAAREVHVLKLQRAFERAGIAPKLKFALRALAFMQEVQPLPSGYWLVAPVRRVDLTELSIVVSPAPLAELKRHFPSTRSAGYARLAQGAELEGLPRQTTESWMRRPPISALEWLQVELTKAKQSMGATTTGEVEFFAVVVKSGFGNIAGWTPSSHLACEVDGVVLCRERIAGRHRYFLGKCNRSRVVSESAIPNDLPRLCIAMAAAADRKLMVICASATDHAAFYIPFWLPRAEHQLMLAVTKRESMQMTKTYRLAENSLKPLLVEALQDMGCGLRHRHA